MPKSSDKLIRLHADFEELLVGLRKQWAPPATSSSAQQPDDAPE